LTVRIKTRADARALSVGLSLGATVGLILGGCYVAGGMARAADTQPRTARLANAAAQGFSEGALRAETATMDPGAVALAEQHDPLGGALAGLRLVPESVDSPGDGAGKTRPSIMHVVDLLGPAAQPFHFADTGALQSARDLDCLTDAVYYEARGETPAGQAAVAQVVLNRVRHPAFPKTVCGVVFQGVAAGDGCQFSFACDGSMRKPREPAAWRRAEQIAGRALSGFVMPSVGNATHFHVIGLDPGWGPRLLRVAQIGLHVFYRFGGYAGAPSTFNGHAQPSGPSDDAPAAADVTVASADGHTGGQIILASTTVVAPGQSAALTPAASSPAKPADAASIITKPADAAPKAKDVAG